MELRQTFEVVCDDLNVESEGYFALLDQNYSQPQRTYHNWTHIESVLLRVAELTRFNPRYSSLDMSLIMFSAFYHDVIYIPGFKGNETMSGALAAEHLNYAEHSWAYNMIVDTRSHDAYSKYAEALCDADLYELGTDKYWTNRDNVRKEFAAATDEQWRVGRRGFLAGYLAKEALFHLPGQTELELKARANMLEELNSLE